MRRYLNKIPACWAEMTTSRRGVFLVVGAVTMVAVLAFMALAVDIGVASLTKSQMQAAVDSAALSGAMEITNALANAGTSVGNVFTYAQQRITETVQLGGVFAFRGFYHDRSRYGKTQCGGVEAIIHQSLGNIFCFYTGALLERPQVHNELVGTGALASRVQDVIVFLQAAFHVIGVEDGVFRGFFDTLSS